jgi:hypothetical protein
MIRIISHRDGRAGALDIKCGVRVKEEKNDT